jgi:hypothetical protein
VNQIVNGNGLRLALMAAESVLNEESPRRLNKNAAATVTRHLRDIVREMRVRWEIDPTSTELREAFRLLGDCADRLMEGD